MPQSLADNFLRVSLAEFKSATKVFTRKRAELGLTLLAFEGGFGHSWMLALRSA